MYDIPLLEQMIHIYSERRHLSSEFSEVYVNLDSELGI